MRSKFGTAAARRTSTLGAGAFFVREMPLTTDYAEAVCLMSAALTAPRQEEDQHKPNHSRREIKGLARSSR